MSLWERVKSLFGAGVQIQQPMPIKLDALADDARQHARAGRPSSIGYCHSDARATTLGAPFRPREPAELQLASEREPHQQGS